MLKMMLLLLEISGNDIVAAGKKGIAVNITSTMMGRFAQDDDKDTSQLQEMGSDAGVVFGYSEKHVRT